jgi:sulfatase maturation enzyme AslB (radical SAM superfamily)
MYNYILTTMGIETKYEYTYYTVIDTEQWRRGNEDIWGTDGFTWAKAINFINHKFKNSEDKSVNNYIVDYAGYEQKIEDWILHHERHKERPVFVQFQEDQPIKTMGEGSLFVIYEEEEDEGYYHMLPDGGGTAEGDTVDGLAGLGGRL